MIFILFFERITKFVVKPEDKKYNTTLQQVGESNSFVKWYQCELDHLENGTNEINPKF